MTLSVAFRRFSTASSRALGSSWAFASSIAVVVAWASTGPHFRWSDSHSLFINTATTIVTFVMVFLIQSSQNRDAALLHAKLDTLLRELREVRDESLVGAQDRPEQELVAQP